jgi:hypothetical protein
MMQNSIRTSYAPMAQRSTARVIRELPSSAVPKGRFGTLRRSKMCALATLSSIERRILDSSDVDRKDDDALDVLVDYLGLSSLPTPTKLPFFSSFPLS